VRTQIAPSRRLNNVSIQFYSHKENSFDVDGTMLNWVLFVKPIIDSLKGRIIQDDNSKIVKEVIFGELFENIEYKKNKMFIMIKEME